MNTYTYKLKTELYREYKVSCEQAVLEQIHDDADYLTLQNSDGCLIVLNQQLPFRGWYEVDSDFFYFLKQSQSVFNDLPDDELSCWYYADDLDFLFDALKIFKQKKKQCLPSPPPLIALSPIEEGYPTKPTSLTILSLGAGVQSSTLALMAMHGEIPKPDYAIFADTGWEPANVLIWLDWLERQLDFPVIRVSNGNLLNDLNKGLKTDSYSYFTPAPFFISGGITKRHCTFDYKIKPITQKIRDLLGLKPRQRSKSKVIQFIGISLDEAHRSKPSRIKWITHKFPLLTNRMTRLDCLKWMKKHGYPEPPKSACVGCPFHSDHVWQQLKTDDSKSFNMAVDIDSLTRSRKLPEYLHRSLKPLADVRFIDDSQVDLFGNECDGICGT